MKTITTEHCHTHFDKDRAPVLTVRPGEEVAFETMDACWGLVHSVEEYLAYRAQPYRGGDPVTGPVYVEGAEPGDTLVVHILQVELTGSGFQLIGPDRAMVRDEVPEWSCWTVTPKGDRFELSNGISLPAVPVIGTFGNAPAGAPINQANPLGGNCDIPAVRPGCRLYIPIEAPGALFSLGDVHACQGDGEVVGAPEVEARVTVRFDVQPGRHADRFMIEDDDEWHSACGAGDEFEAGRLAVFQNARFIAARHGIELEDALVLLTMVGRLTICVTGGWNGPRVVCSSFSKRSVTDALKGYRPPR